MPTPSPPLAVPATLGVVAQFAAIPRMDLAHQDLAAIPGRVPPLDAMPAGCRFLPWPPHLKAAGSGRVVNVASLSGKRARNASIGYAMTKFSLVALTHGIRHDGWDAGVRATALCPGFVATDMTSRVTKIARTEMTDPADIAVLVETLLRLPNTAVIAELLVNCQHEDGL
jgi:NAD(P)-dependent dehydrogenase (short-subunit alcohol dehydrogenase family)